MGGCRRYGDTNLALTFRQTSRLRDSRVLLAGTELRPVSLSPAVCIRPLLVLPVYGREPESGRRWVQRRRESSGLLLYTAHGRTLRQSLDSLLDSLYTQFEGETEDSCLPPLTTSAGASIIDDPSLRSPPNRVCADYSTRSGSPKNGGHRPVHGAPAPRWEIVLPVREPYLQSGFDFTRRSFFFLFFFSSDDRLRTSPFYTKIKPGPSSDLVFFS